MSTALVDNMWRWGFLAVVFSLVFSGCAFLQYHPQSYIPDKISDSGVALYNKVGLPISDSGWALVGQYVDESYQDLEDCAGPIDPDVASKIRNAPIVLFPGRPLFIFGKEIGAFTNLEFIFIRRDKISTRGFLLEERVHMYLYYTGRRLFGDFFHRDPLFKKCMENIGRVIGRERQNVNRY